MLRNNDQGIKTTMDNDNTSLYDGEKPEDTKQKIMLLEHELEDQKEVYKQLKAYVGEVLGNIMVTNPQMLERK